MSAAWSAPGSALWHSRKTAVRMSDAMPGTVSLLSRQCWHLQAAVSLLGSFPEPYHHCQPILEILEPAQCNQLAKFLTEIRILNMNRAKSDGSVLGPIQMSSQPINQPTNQSNFAVVAMQAGKKMHLPARWAMQRLIH